VLSSGDIEESDLRLSENIGVEPNVGSDQSDLPFSDAKKRAMNQFERGFLLRALRDKNGNISRAAESIGMVRQSLQQKIRELGLRSEDWTNGDGGSASE